LFTPVSSPGVANIPELDSIFFTPTNYGNLVDGVEITSGVVINTTYIVIKGLWNRYWTSKWTTLI
jgi:hypothetical protein